MSSPPPDRSALLGALDLALRKVSAQSVLLGQAVADRVGINPTDLECLDLLRWTGPVTAGRLAEETGLTTGAITGVVDRLERAGYVRRERDPHDRRRVIVRPLLDRADREIGPLYASMSRAMGELWARYGDDELALLLDFAGRAELVTREEIAKLRAGAGKPNRAASDGARERPRASAGGTVP